MMTMMMTMMMISNMQLTVNFVHVYYCKVLVSLLCRISATSIVKRSCPENVPHYRAEGDFRDQ